MSKKKESPSTVLLKAIVTYLTDEVQRPDNLKNMDYIDLSKFIDETGILKALNNEGNKTLRENTLVFALKMVLMRLGERVDINNKEGRLSVTKNSLPLYEFDIEELNSDNVKSLCFELICKAGMVIQVLKDHNLSDMVDEENQTAFAI